MNKLDMKTRFFLYITKLNVVEHEEVKKGKDPKKMLVERVNKNDVYLFNDYLEYVNFYKMYLRSIKEELISFAIKKVCKNGNIIALKEFCDELIIRQASKEFYQALTNEDIELIHSEGKLSSYDKVKEWESLDLCTPGDAVSSAADRCKFFKNCHECLMEYASHNEEYNKFDFKLIDYGTHKVLGKKLDN